MSTRAAGAAAGVPGPSAAGCAGAPKPFPLAFLTPPLATSAARFSFSSIRLKSSSLAARRAASVSGAAGKFPASRSRMRALRVPATYRKLGAFP